MKTFKLLTSLVIVVLLVGSFVSSTAVGADTSDPERVWVSYESGRQAEVLKYLNEIGATIHFDFPDLQSFVVTMPTNTLNGIFSNPFITEIEADPVRYLIEPIRSEFDTTLFDPITLNGQVIPYGIDMVGAREVWDANHDGIVDPGANTGSGKTICIIDSGYYQDHEDLPVAVGGYSQVDDNWARDGFGHGSHVGGTIAAENNGLGVVGVTPGTVDLHIIKFFADDGYATTASNLVDALSRCVTAGADIVSMSLGGSRSSTREEKAFNNAYAAGVLSIAAAGNEGTTAHSYPASYDSVVSVAAIDSTMTIADFSQFNSQVELAAPGVGVLSTIPYIESNSLVVDGVSYQANHIEFSAYGTASGQLVDGGLCAIVGAWSGKVVLCKRGTQDFYTKVMNVQNGGGTAAVIYNNEPGGFLGTLGEGNTSSIIGLSISQEDGQYLVEICWVPLPA